ncbi:MULTISPECIES: Ig-like domain-containing protein [unclassified Lentimonas]|uniref:Ig-like domain-containing protein n=1 Tax=unclassified Lentimonas TaxID=2630993 RepID=UPI0013238858|nr:MULTISPECIES: Ig-like domain-containing protein [unclassified Lentimonas]CAA6677916.1 Unannotated [Lentimonas sp. CC4]CAA6684020.1 Unannotated [Lentimonas sp. CC6]CAA7076604.1 Unannotated [Lentimonas sp. CC4]CAA7170067.1 Unannotated [Lentimonas sp. CC21]CAA7181352.1 Unannotated [Lentimonas sp. CC8]
MPVYSSGTPWAYLPRVFTISAFSFFCAATAFAVLPTPKHAWDFTNGSGADSGSIGTTDLIISQASKVADRDGNANAALDFDGINDDAVTSSNNLIYNPHADAGGSGKVSISGWFKMDPSYVGSGTDQLFSIEKKYVLSYADGAFQPYFDGSAGLDSYGEGYNDGAWHHFVMQNDGLQTQFYLDGSLVVSFSEAMSNLDSLSKKSGFGADFRGRARHFEGSLDDLQYFDVILTSAQIRELAGLSTLPPVAQNDIYLIVENQARSISAPGVLQNDYDADGDALVATLVTEPSSGTLTFDADGSFDYTPATDFTGDVSFTYKADESTSSDLYSSNVVTVTLQVVAESQVLTSAEVAQINTDLDLSLSGPLDARALDLAAIVKPQGSGAWRTDAEARIESSRKSDLTVEVVDALGNPIQGATVTVNQSNSAFKFSGSVKAFDVNNGKNNFTGTLTTALWKSRALALFNALGTNNALKPKLDQSNSSASAAVDLINWTEAENIPVRGHTAMWPGTASLADVDDLGFDPTDSTDVDWDQDAYDSLMNHLSPYVRNKVEEYIAARQGGGDLTAARAAVKAAANTEVQNWVSNSPGGLQYYKTPEHRTSSTLTTQTSHAKGWNVYEWDVINETITNTLLMEIIDDPATTAVDEGMQCMAQWMNTARAAMDAWNPSAKLLINDYQIISAKSSSLVPDSNGTSYATRSTILKERLDQVINDGGALESIGFQSRFKFEHPDPTTLYSRLVDFGNEYNLPMCGTEFEIWDGGRLDDASNKNFTEFERAQMTEEILTTYFSHPLVYGLTVWSFAGDPSEPQFMMGYDGSLNLNALAWYYLHRIRYTSQNVSDVSDANGAATLRGFHGEYDVSVSYAGSTGHALTTTLTADGTIQVQLSDVSLAPFEPTANGITLEDWQFDDLVDTQLKDTHNAASNTAFNGFTPNIVTDGDGSIVVTSGSDQYKTSGSLSIGSRTTGRYELLAHIDTLDFSEADDTGASVGFSFRDSSISTSGFQDIFYIRLIKQGGSLLLQARVDNANTTLNNFGATALSNSLTIRSVINLDTGTAEVFFASGAADEVSAGVVNLASQAKVWDQVRLVATASEFTGADFAKINLVTISELPTLYATSSLLEEWNFEGAADVQLQGALNSAGTAAFGGATANATTNGSGLLHITQGADATDNLYRNGGNLTVGARSSGIYEIQFRIDTIDFSGGDLGGSNVAFGMRDSSITTGGFQDVILIRLQEVSSKIQLQARLDNSTSVLHTFSSNVVNDLVVRVVIDLDNDTADIYYALASVDEVAVASDLPLGSLATTWDLLRFISTTNTTDWGQTDYATVDYLRVSKVDLGNYDEWSSAVTWSGETQTHREDDPDGDGVNNFMEYALGGNPLLADSHSNRPILSVNAGVPYLDFQLGTDPVDVEYRVEHSYDLVDWSSITPTIVTGMPGDTVSVDISDVASKRFSRLTVRPKLQP